MLELSMKKPTAQDASGSGRAPRPRRAASRNGQLPDMSAYGRLAEYNRKRHFDVTPEPPGTARRLSEGRRKPPLGSGGND
jgi:hypothetical protein